MSGLNYMGGKGEGKVREAVFYGGVRGYVCVCLRTGTDRFVRRSDDSTATKARL